MSVVPFLVSCFVAFIAGAVIGRKLPKRLSTPKWERLGLPDPSDEKWSKGFRDWKHPSGVVVEQRGYGYRCKVKGTVVMNDAESYYVAIQKAEPQKALKKYHEEDLERLLKA